VNLAHSSKDPALKRTLITGATGYVGGRLLGTLESSASSRSRLRALARRPEFLDADPSTEVVAGDLLDAATLLPALDGVDTAYYLVHSMGTSGDFESEEARAAENFANAAAQARVSRIVYLGGLGEGSELSRHLRSRQRVGEILGASGIPTVELRASIVIGSGSLSFEMVRALVEKLPVMITPSWVRVRAQPIAIEDLIAYLVAAADIDIDAHTVVEIGGLDSVSYADIMQEYATQRGLHRFMLPVPVLSPGLSSRWLGLITPLYARIGRKLLDSVRNPTVVTDDSARRHFPAIEPRGIGDAISRALKLEDAELAATRWTDAISSRGSVRTWAGVKFKRRIMDSRAADVPVSPASAFAPIRRIGGKRGWYFGTTLWRLRGFIDLLFGGVGTRRGRTDPEQFHAGDHVDFWRVESVEPDRRVRLFAEMKVPGRAWLEFEVKPTDTGAIIRQTAIYDPVGLFGILYWYALYPVHAIVFRGMLAGIARAATAGADS
jgi:uncharacterized protein YbjT (DUF2867 family)